MIYLKILLGIFIASIILAAVFFIALYIALEDLNFLDKKTDKYIVGDTSFYVTKKVWGIAGGHEITVVSPYKDTLKALKDGHYNPSFEGLICFSSLTKTVIKEGSLITYCNAIPDEQVNQKVYNGVTFSIQEPENNELADVKY